MVACAMNTIGKMIICTGTVVRSRGGVKEINTQDNDTIALMQNVVAWMVGKRLMYRELIAN